MHYGRHITLMAIIPAMSHQVDLGTQVVAEPLALLHQSAFIRYQLGEQPVDGQENRLGKSRQDDGKLGFTQASLDLDPLAGASW